MKTRSSTDVDKNALLAYVTSDPVLNEFKPQRLTVKVIGARIAQKKNLLRKKFVVHDSIPKKETKRNGGYKSARGPAYVSPIVALGGLAIVTVGGSYGLALGLMGLALVTGLVGLTSDRKGFAIVGTLISGAILVLTLVFYLFLSSL